MRQVDYLIVGLGLAGSVLSRMLLARNKSILVIDSFNKNSSSQVAAGLVNPVTGRRVVKSWMADQLIPFAKKYFQTVEQETGSLLYHQCDVLEIVHSVKEVNDWTSRMSEPEMSGYLLPSAPENLYRNKISDFKKMFRITSSGWMNIPEFIRLTKEDLVSKNLLIEQHFDVSNIIAEEDKISYPDRNAKKIIFCEGHKTLQNPLWDWLPFLPAKGEILTIHCGELPEDFILMSGMFIIPLGDHKFRVGATYEWNYTHEEATDNAKMKLVNQLNEFLQIPFEVIDHRAGIRPTVKDRRPIIGKHPSYENAFIFNGMGTKGVQLAPYFGEQFVKYLEENDMLMAEVNVDRFTT
jgi:glycine oxidase